MDVLISQATSAIVGLIGSDLPLAYQSGLHQLVTIRGVFDAAHETQNLGESGIVSQGPQLFLQLAGLPTDPEEDREAIVIVDGHRYQIHAVEKDGKGGALLRLRHECNTPGV